MRLEVELKVEVYLCVPDPLVSVSVLCVAFSRSSSIICSQRRRRSVYCPVSIHRFLCFVSVCSAVEPFWAGPPLFYVLYVCLVDVCLCVCRDGIELAPLPPIIIICPFSLFLSCLRTKAQCNISICLLLMMLMVLMVVVVWWASAMGCCQGLQFLSPLWLPFLSLILICIIILHLPHSFSAGYRCRIASF